MIDLTRLPSLQNVTYADLEALKDRGAREGPQLEYKGSLGPFSDKAKFELVKDISAFANANGGLIIYGATQTEDGAISALPGLSVESADLVSSQVDLIVNDNLDHRIPGFSHRFIDAPDGRRFLMVRVPRSPLAPHMITFPTTHPRFYSRVNTVSVPLTMDQIKAIVLRGSESELAATRYISERVRGIELGGASAVFFFAVPLFNGPHDLDISSEGVTRALSDLGGVMLGGSPTYTTAGFSVRYYTESRKHHVLFSRSGAVEYVNSPIIRQHHNGASIISPFFMEAEAIKFFDAVAGNAIPGLATPPVLLALRIIGTKDSLILGSSGFTEGDVCASPDILPEPEVANAWEDRHAILKHFFDFMWQAYGIRRSPSYASDGTRTARV